MIDHSIVFLPCSDIEKTTVFYHEILGFPIVSVQAGGRLKIFDTGGGCWGFQMRKDGYILPEPGRICLSLECENTQDVDDYYQKLTENGIITKGRPYMNPDFPVYSFFFEDPSGYTVEIQKITR